MVEIFYFDSFLAPTAQLLSERDEDNHRDGLHLGIDSTILLVESMPKELMLSVIDFSVSSQAEFHSGIVFRNSGVLQYMDSTPFLYALSFLCLHTNNEHGHVFGSHL